jgi:hypothetical protein
VLILQPMVSVRMEWLVCVQQQIKVHLRGRLRHAIMLRMYYVHVKEQGVLHHH